MRGEWMESEIREQPALWSEHANRYESEIRQFVAGRSFDSVVVVARGSSDNAGLYARYLIEISVGIPVVLAAPSVLTRYGRRVRFGRTLALGISQSGAGPDVSEVLQSIREDGGATLAITNTEGSRITQAAEGTLLLGLGEERSIAATKSYSASLLAIYGLARALGGDLPSSEGRLPGAEWVEHCRLAAMDQAGYLLRSSLVFLLARGIDFCTAHEAALKLMECALLPCKAYSRADFEHGPKAIAGPGTATIVFGGDALGLEQLGSLPVVAPSFSRDLLAPLGDIVFAQWLALFAARARNLDPDRSEVLRKVTQTR